MLWLDYLSIKQISNLFSCFLLSFKSFSLHSHSYLTSFLSTFSLIFTILHYSSHSLHSHQHHSIHILSFQIKTLLSQSPFTTITLQSTLSIFPFHSSFILLNYLHHHWVAVCVRDESICWSQFTIHSISISSHSTLWYDQTQSLITISFTILQISLFFHSSTYQSFIIFTHSSSVVCLRWLKRCQESKSDLWTIDWILLNSHELNENTNVETPLNHIKEESMNSLLSKQHVLRDPSVW